MIKNLNSSSPISSLADPCRNEKIRIAIIDTGIDEDDIIIGEVMGERIKECCGFINGPDAKPDPSDYEDKTGHGTHVARLMLKMAPSVELYIAKISNEFSIQPTELHRVTRVSPLGFSPTLCLLPRLIFFPPSMHLPNHT